ncbi:TetR/AcrR family transcriptional regulator [Vibrio astriarenae]|uniref:TetR/AcrR family transcriptional regulator n=1 Tax=Vibrio astriarenae TaxID=1481923 RepID=UPI0037358691
MNKKESDKRQRILESAEKLIAEVGFQGLSMNRLAKDAGVAAGTIYRYFEDKDHLLDEVRIDVMRRVATEVQKDIDESTDVKQRYRQAWFNIWHLAESNASSFSSRIQYDSLPCSDFYRKRKQELQLFSKVNQIFDDGKEQGVFKPLANEILAGLTFEACATISRKNAMGLYVLSPQDIEAAFNASWDAIINH